MKAAVIFRTGRTEVSFDFDICSETSEIPEREIREIVVRAKNHQDWISRNGDPQ